MIFLKIINQGNFKMHSNLKNDISQDTIGTFEL